MQAAAAFRLARTRTVTVAARQPTRCLATTTLDAAAAGSPSTSSSAAPAAPIPLSNVEAQWEMLSPEERHSVHQQLEEVQKKDWKALSLDEKKAAYYVAFGPHGPRAPASKPGESVKVFLGVLGVVGVSGLIQWGIRATAPESPKTINREWEEAANERAREQKMNPISGITSEGYSGKGFVTHK